MSNPQWLYTLIDEFEPFRDFISFFFQIMRHPWWLEFYFHRDADLMKCEICITRGLVRSSQPWSRISWRRGKGVFYKLKVWPVSYRSCCDSVCYIPYWTALTHWSMGDMVVILKYNPRTHVRDQVHAHVLRNCPQVNTTEKSLTTRQN